MMRWVVYLIEFIVVIAIIAAGGYYVYDKYVTDKYDYDNGYINDLSELDYLYLEETREKILDRDLIAMGFVSTGEQKYERAYNENTCEIFTITEEEYMYYITDVCINIMEDRIVKDFNHDGKNLLYFKSSEDSKAYLRIMGSGSAGVITYDFATKQYHSSGDALSQEVMQRYNHAYESLIREFNARVF